MKLMEIKKGTPPASDKTKSGGTYAAAKLSDDTKENITKYFKENDIPEPCDVDDMHCTILYSRKPCPDYKAAGEYDGVKIGKPTPFDVWQSQDKTKNILVLPLDAPEMTARHEELMKEHDASYDFPDYKPHVSFTYNFGDRDAKDLPPVDFDIEFATEYQEELDPST